MSEREGEVECEVVDPCREVDEQDAGAEEEEAQEAGGGEGGKGEEAGDGVAVETEAVEGEDCVAISLRFGNRRMDGGGRRTYWYTTLCQRRR